MNTQNTKRQGYSAGQGEAIFTNFKNVRSCYGYLTGYAILEMFDGRFLLAPYESAKTLERQGYGKILERTEIYAR